MDTTITISSKSVTNKSDFLHLTYNTGKNKDAIISVDSSNFGQSGTVTWDKKSSTLSNIEKVTNWMKQSDKECIKDELTELKDNEPESKSLILFRCDFNKSTNVPTYYPALNPFNRSTSLIDYFKDENVTLSNSLKVPVSSTMDDGTKVTEQKFMNNYQQDRISSQISKTESSYSSENKSENTDEVPLSPESRKKELCHYLQLMNPADKKEILILQNRRSSRVRNLTEQKQFQEKLKELNVDSLEKNDPIEKSATLKSFKELNIQVNDKLDDADGSEKSYKGFLFPFPPQKLSAEINNFDNVMYKLIPKLKSICKTKNLPCLTKNKISEFEVVQPKKYYSKIIKPKGKSKNLLKVVRRSVKQRNKLLRSNGNLKNVPIKKLVEKKEKELNRAKKTKSVALSSDRSKLSSPPQSIKSRKHTSPTKSISSHCEIISVGLNQDEDNIDTDHIMDDMVDFEKLSEEHKKCLIESRILSTKPLNNESNSNSNNIMSPLYGFSQKDTNEISKICEKYKNTVSLDSLRYNTNGELKERKENTIEVQKNQDSEDKDKQEATQVTGGNTYLILNIHTPSSSEETTDSSEVSEHSNSSSLQEHDYASLPSKQSENEQKNKLDTVKVPMKTTYPNKYLEISTKSIARDPKYELLPYKKSEGVKSLHKSLQYSTRKKNCLAANAALTQEWDIGNSPKQKLKKQSHYISINPEHGSVLRAFYVGYNLILCQEFLISFWMQTPLGNVLGSQNMWIPRGQTQRIVLNNRCLQKDSTEKVICTDTSVVYIELCMKEHKSEMRQGPVADVFITLYYWKQRQNGLDKKVLQLENINGFADDVQYCVMRNFPKIIVSWHSANEENITSRRTFIHAYQLASDYQTVSNIFDIEPVDHYVSSLHNIEDYEDLLMGCGENKITLWNIEFGHIIATIELNDIKTPLSTLWVKCDRGFLFALQQCVDRELRLIAINGINHSWKKLASYFPPEGFDRLKGVCIENGLLLSFYDQGILCWNAETGEPIEEINAENDVIPSGTHVILLEDNQIIVKHVLTHLMSMSIDES